MLDISAATYLNVLGSQLGRSFLRHLHHFLRLLLLRDLQVGFLGHELDMGGRRIISYMHLCRIFSMSCYYTIDTAVSTVGPSAHLRRLVAISVRDSDLIDVQPLRFGIRLDVSQKIQKRFGCFLRPCHFVTWSLVLFSSGVSSDTTGIFGDGNRLLILQHVG